MKWLFGSVVAACVTIQCFPQAGHLDPTFRPVFDNRIASLAIQPDGRILAGGTFQTVNGESKSGIARLNSDGTTDRSFTVTADAGTGAIVLTPDGNIMIMGGFTKINGVNRYGIAKLRSDGSLDESFNTDSRQDRASIFALQPSGHVVVSGFEGVDRLNPDGILDTSFRVRLNQFGYLMFLEGQPDGKILIAGNFRSLGGLLRNTVARLLPDGTVDSDFDTSSVYLGERSQCLLSLPDGKVIVGGQRFTRLLANGSRDTSFFYPDTSNTGGGEYGLVMQRDNKIIAGGWFTSHDGIIYQTNLARYFANDGSPDPSFKPGFGPNNQTGTSPVSTIAIQSDQRILVAGNFTDYDGSGQQYLARVLNDWPVLDSRQITENQMELRWPAAYTNFVLQTASSVSSTNWIALTNPPVVISNLCIVTNTITSGHQFFRLARP